MIVPSELFPHFYSLKELTNNKIIFGFTDSYYDFSVKNRMLELKKNLLNLNFKVNDIFNLSQEHGSTIIFVDDRNKHFNYSADGCFTNKPNLLLSIFTADCLPLFFFIKQPEPIVAIVHAGWRGILSNISANFIASLFDKYNVNLGEIKVCIGPSIRKCCFEIQDDIINLFPVTAIDKRNSKTYVDLHLIVKEQLLISGLHLENIYDSNICSCCSSGQFFSYRATGTKKRMRSIIMLSG